MFNLLPQSAVRCILFSVVFLISGCQIELYSDLPENEANEIVAILVTQGIASEKLANKKEGSFTVNVEETEMAKAIDILKQQGYPKERFVSTDDLFSKDGLISSPLEERVRFIYSLSQGVQETLSRIDGVVTARVHIVLPENNPLADEIKPSSASVFIKHLPESNLGDFKSDIKLIVQKSIEGLSYDKVSVVMLPAQPSFSSTEQQWSRVWGFRVANESASSLSTLLWGLSVLFMAIIVGCFYLLRQSSSPSTSTGKGKTQWSKVVAMAQSPK